MGVIVDYKGKEGEFWVDILCFNGMFMYWWVLFLFLLKVLIYWFYNELILINKLSIVMENVDIVL